jgi:hypothetical protein
MVTLLDRPVAPSGGTHRPPRPAWNSSGQLRTAFRQSKLAELVDLSEASLRHKHSSINYFHE